MDRRRQALSEITPLHNNPRCLDSGCSRIRNRLPRVPQRVPQRVPHGITAVLKRIEEFACCQTSKLKSAALQHCQSHPQHNELQVEALQKLTASNQTVKLEPVAQTPPAQPTPTPSPPVACVRYTHLSFSDRRQFLLPATRLLGLLGGDDQRMGGHREALPHPEKGSLVTRPMFSLGSDDSEANGK